MSKYDDEFKDVKRGVPTGGASQKAGINFVVLFTVIGVLFFLVIVLFQDTIRSEGEDMVKNGYVMQQAIVNGILALLVGGIQAWIFKAKIKTRGYIFVTFSALGGLLAGLIGGMLVNSGVTEPILIGLLNGAMAGGFSSLAQNKIMKNEKYATSWFMYSLVSWAAVFAIGWMIGWDTPSMVRTAAAGGFLVIASGVGLAIFLINNPQIEFS